MDRGTLSAALATGLPQPLADDLADQFLVIRQDVATETLGRAAPGKFVETIVQCLQALENGGQYDAHPNVDRYLRGLESRQSQLPDGLRICAARLARAMYALRSKRNIVHKATVDPSAYDLRFLYSGAQWVLAEFLALTQGLPGDDAARLIRDVQLPVGELVEVLGDRRIVHADMTIRNEALTLLMSHYPDPIPVADLQASMDRRSAKAVSNEIGMMWKEKLVHREDDRRILLTEAGLREAIAVAKAHMK